MLEEGGVGDVRIEELKGVGDEVEGMVGGMGVGLRWLEWGMGEEGVEGD